MACTIVEEGAASANTTACDLEFPGEPDSDKVYVGAVKSYNERRGFGFIACEETSCEFGRDVYMAKLEGQLAAAGVHRQPQDDPEKAMELLNSRLAILAEKTPERAGTQLRLADDDIVLFMVKLSVEGYPQAVRVRRMHKFQGSVVRSPERDDTLSSTSWKPGLITCQEVTNQMGGQGEVLLHQDSCGQVRLVPGDIVTFCIPESEDPPEAKLVTLASTARPAGSVLACCHLELPRPASEGRSSSPSLRLNCHALANKLILSGLSRDVGEHELMRFFSKRGASKAVVAHAKGGSFASVTFPNVTDVCMFLGRRAHAVADEKQTRTATLHDSRHSHEGRLPALPTPTLSPGDEPASILVTWAPLQLAVSYVVEMRPAGTKESWARVDTCVGENGGGCFGMNFSSCKVSDLRPGFAYEARVSYVSSCRCRSDASEASQAVIPGNAHRSEECTLHGAPLSSVAHTQHGQPTISGYEFSGNSQQMPCAGWCCAHGTLIPLPSPPEVLAADEAGFSVAVRWPSVGHASAYVVELRETGSSFTERFVRSAESSPAGSVLELRVGGLRPIPGRTYMAQVRCISHCGCESAPSREGYSPVMGCHMRSEATMMATGPSMMATTPYLPLPNEGHVPPPPPPPPKWMPGMRDAQLPLPAQHPAQEFSHTSPWQVPAGCAYMPYNRPLPDSSPNSAHLVPFPAADVAMQQPAVHTKDPSKAKCIPVTEKVAEWKEPPPEVTGQEECLVLD